VFTSHDVTDNQTDSVTTEIYVMNTDGTGLTRLTFNGEEERGPSWSPDGTKIVFSCRRGGPDFELCLMNADGSGQVQLTDNDAGDLTASFSPDGTKILFHRTGGPQQLFTIKSDGSGETRLTGPPGINLLASWGLLRTHVTKPRD
jgi:TolB protein